MSRGLNKIQIIGRLGRDPEMRYTPDGKAVTNFSVATGGKWTDRNGTERDDTEWFRVEMWERQAETANQYLSKGAQVYIEGRLRTRKYTDKDGIERTSVEVVANNMLLLGSRNDRGSGPGTSDHDDYGDEDTAPAQPARPAARATNDERSAPSSAPSRPPARPAPAARPSGRNQPQPFDNEEDLPF